MPEDKLPRNTSIGKTSFIFESSPFATISHKSKDQFSRISIQWLKYVEHIENIQIQHALNGGEKHIFIEGKAYRIDGFCHATRTCYEYHGCLFHGCITCYPSKRDTFKTPYTKQSLNELYTITMKKKSLLEKAGYKYVCMWDHEFQTLVNDTRVAAIVKTFDVSDRLNVRDSFFGGRTNASTLYHKCKSSEKIKYVDFTSLYPWVNKYARYPVGHPEVITAGFASLDSYFGIAKVSILPPRNLYHPVLPYRSNGKLNFPLCATCADTLSQTNCQHSASERSILGTWCIPEILQAVKKGYTINCIHEILHWNSTTQYDPTSQKGGLFSEYVNTFLKFKQEASGWPEWCSDPSKKKMYLDQYLKNESVKLDADSIETNPGLRSLSKLCLNSFWGKYGQRDNLKQSALITCLEEDKFFQIVTDITKSVSNFYILNDSTIELEWTEKDKFIEDNPSSNIYIATFTTCWARLKLYSILEQLDRNVLYYDTDSIIYVSDDKVTDPPLGDYLGELTDELGGGGVYIDEYVSGGPKNYAYKTSTGDETVKVRGFTLNYKNSQLINFDSVKQLVITNSKSTIPINNPCKITRNKRKRTLFNSNETKDYRIVYTKRVVLNNLDTLPYGY